jgi:hypothetical protein
VGDHVERPPCSTHRPAGGAVVGVERGAEEVAGGIVEAGHPVPALPHLAECVLGQVFGLVTAVSEHVERAEEPPLVGHVEAFERQRGSYTDNERCRLG